RDLYRGGEPRAARLVLRARARGATRVLPRGGDRLATRTRRRAHAAVARPAAVFRAREPCGATRVATVPARRALRALGAESRARAGRDTATGGRAHACVAAARAGRRSLRQHTAGEGVTRAVAEREATIRVESLATDEV